MAISVSTVERLITKNGRTVTLVTKSSSPAVGEKDWGQRAASVEISVTAVFVASEHGSRRNATKLMLSPAPGDYTPLSGDQQVLIAGNVANVEKGDLLRDGGINYRIETVAVVQPGATRYLYDAVVRR